MKQTMKDKGGHYLERASTKPVWLVFAFAIFFWLLEAATHAFVFFDDSFGRAMFSPDPHEIWMRLILAGHFIVFGIYAQVIVTQRKRAEDATRLAHGEIDQIFQTAADAMRVIDKDFNVLRVNETFVKLSGVGKGEAIGTLAGGIAHDFNNLLMGIRVNVSLMLLDKKPTDPDYGRIMNIDKQVQSAARLTSHLSGYARKGKYEIQPININPLVKETSDTFSRTKKEITVHTELAADLLTIEADPGQIEQVLWNLYINAADAMSGSETYDRLKKIDPEIKVILFSGYSIDGEASEILKRGCNGFIQKPFSIKNLSGKIREVLDHG